MPPKLTSSQLYISGFLPNRHGRRGPHARRLVVLVQVGLEGEGLVASRTLKILGWRVCLHVRPKVGPIRKGLSAHRAGIRLVTSVGAQVALQQPGSREGLTAHVTLVVEVVREDVHGERWHGHVHLATDVALLGIGGVEAPVGLLVPGEVGTGGIVLATLGADILVLAIFRVVTSVLVLLRPPVCYVELQTRFLRRRILEKSLS